MALADDLVTLVLLAGSGFFVALAVGLMVRYRRVSQTINASSDMSHDLWMALEQRMKKQDERILDVMGRLEVIQSRMMAAAVAQTSPPIPPTPLAPEPRPPGDEKPKDVTWPPPVVQQGQQSASQTESRPESPESQPLPAPIALDETQLAVLRLLGEGQKNTRQLTDALVKSREHTARLMKGLFERGFVGRNSSTKPFVYQLTDAGRRRLSQGTQPAGEGSTSTSG